MTAESAPAAALRTASEGTSAGGARCGAGPMAGIPGGLVPAGLAFVLAMTVLATGPLKIWREQP